MQVVEAPVASRTDGFAKLKQQLDAADVDIVLVNHSLTRHRVSDFFGDRHIIRAA